MKAILPPSDKSVDLVTILIVPPTDGIGSLAEPRPLWTCIADVTSLSPAQLLQYTLPFSISLTGIPLTKTAIFSCWNPRSLTLASPNPPCIVEYIPGVEFRSWGSSRFPTLSTICSAFKVDAATGVSLSLAKSIVPKTVTPDRILSVGDNSIFPALAPSTLISADS